MAASDEHCSRLSCRGTALLLCLALATLLVIGCGGASRPVAASHASTYASDTVSTAATTTPTASSASPELIVCQEEPGSRAIQLDALSGDAEGVTVAPVASFSNLSEKTCSVSPDLTKLAELSETSDGSKLAGYVPAGGGGFVNLSGHDSNSYSDTPVEDQDPLFNPVTGELWWMVNENGGDSLWSAPTTGGSLHDHGPNRLGGNLAAFTAAGEPLASSMPTSPDGSLTAVNSDAELDVSGDQLTIGKSSAFAASCHDNVTDCPGAASITFSEPSYQSSVACESFIGFASDSAFICRVNDNGRERFDRLSFKLEGHQLKIISDVPLTPPTQMALGGVRVSADGKTLWYIATRQATPGDSNEQQANLYVIRTDTPTPEPAPAVLTPAIPLATITMAGWRLHGQFIY